MHHDRPGGNLRSSEEIQVERPRTAAEIAKAVASLRGNPRFAALLERFADRLARDIVIREELPVPRLANVDGSLAERAREVAIRLLTLDLLDEAPEADVELARALVDQYWRETPLVANMPDDDGKRRALPFLHGEPWQRALARVFEAYWQIPIAAPFDAVRLVLSELVGHAGVEVPTVFRDAHGAMKNAKDLTEIAPASRQHVDEAIALMRTLRGPDSEDGKATMRITLNKAGGRARPIVSPWGAAVKFATAFGRTMPERPYDATRTTRPEQSQPKRRKAKRSQTKRSPRKHKTT